MTNKALVAIYSFFGLSLLVAIILMGTNYIVDPLCYFKCQEVDVERTNQNYYYQSAQMIAANPHVEAIILGSSRGERVSAEWVSSHLQQKALNLSQGGADTLLKIALSNIALQKQPDLKTVIWLADYFEFLSITTSEKVKFTPVLSRELPADALSMSEFDYFWGRLHILIDHNTFEASLSMPKAKMFDKNGSGAHLKAEVCASESFAGEVPNDMMLKQVSNTYPGFSKLLKIKQNDKYLAAFEAQLIKLKSKGLRVIVNISPYHPEFEKRFAVENPNLLILQQNWFERMKALREKGIEVLDYSKGIPTDDGSPKFWEDGVHPTCYGDIKMLSAI